jgi:hypothetical protein
VRKPATAIKSLTSHLLIVHAEKPKNTAENATNHYFTEEMLM